jgi:hypothetical protein
MGSEEELASQLELAMEDNELLKHRLCDAVRCCAA